MCDNSCHIIAPTHAALYLCLCGSKVGGTASLTTPNLKRSQTFDGMKIQLVCCFLLCVCMCMTPLTYLVLETGILR